MTDAHRPTDAEARALADGLLRRCTHLALATLAGGAPHVSRVGCAWIEDAGLLILASDLATHAANLAADDRCSAMVEGAAGKGDVLTHPRLSLMGRAPLADKGAHRDAFLAARPKASLFYDFGDFRLRRIVVERAELVAGFGAAYRLGPSDLPGAAS